MILDVRTDQNPAQYTTSTQQPPARASQTNGDRTDLSLPKSFPPDSSGYCIMSDSKAHHRLSSRGRYRRDLQ